jgi:anaerobic C4-dicarboxylate transporter
MPTHAVAGHLAIISAPVVAVLAFLYALRPGARRMLRLPLLAGVVVNACLTIWATLAGGPLYRELRALAESAEPVVDLRTSTLPHAKQGDWLTVASFLLAVVVVVLVFWRLSPARRAAGTAHVVAVGVLVMNAALVAWYTVTTLQLAMRSVWSNHQLWGG